MHDEIGSGVSSRALTASSVDVMLYVVVVDGVHCAIACALAIVTRHDQIHEQSTRMGYLTSCFPEARYRARTKAICIKNRMRRKEYLFKSCKV